MKALLLGQLFIFRTIFQRWELPFDIPATSTGLFTNYFEIWARVFRALNNLFLNDDLGRVPVH